MGSMVCDDSIYTHLCLEIHLFILKTSILRRGGNLTYRFVIVNCIYECMYSNVSQFINSSKVKMKLMCMAQYCVKFDWCSTTVLLKKRGRNNVFQP